MTEDIETTLRESAAGLADAPPANSIAQRENDDICL